MYKHPRATSIVWLQRTVWLACCTFVLLPFFIQSSWAQCPASTSAGPAQNKCNNASFVMAATPAPAGSTGAWSVVSGAATIATTASPTTTVTVTTSPATLRWTVSRTGCTAVSATVVLTNTVTTTSNAGPAQTKCNKSSFTLAANAPAAGETATWSVVSGAATFASLTTRNTTATVTTSPATLRWTITRGSCSSASTVTLTNVVPTLSVAGPAQTQCRNNLFTLAANAPASGETGTWTVTGGAATIASPNSRTSTVTVTTSPATLRWTIANGTCTSISSVVLTNVVPTTSNAGPAQTKCNNASFTLAANAPASGETGAWSVVSGAASLASATVRNTTATVTASPAVLRWTITRSGCTSSSTVTLTNVVPTVSVAGPAQTNCNNNVFTLAANAPAATETGTWTVTAGAATIASPNSRTSSVTVTTSPATLRWTIANGTCTSASTVVLTNNISTISNAGPAQTKCNNASFTLAANAPASGETGSWSVLSGAATITTVSSRTSAVTVTASPAVLRWTITRGSCSSSSTVTLTNIVPTVSAAGPAQTNCNNNIFTMAANAAATGETGTWTVTGGAATIVSANSRTSTVTVTTSPATLRWTISNGTCSSSTFSSVVLTSNVSTISNAGPDQTQCNNNIFTLAANAPVSGETGTWSVVSGAANVANAGSRTSSATVTNSPAVLRWTITRGSCSSTSIVTLNNVVPSVSAAGPAQNNCNNSTFTMTANVPADGESGLWTVSEGSAELASVSSFNSSATLAGNTATLVWTITRGTCSTSSSVKLTNTLPSQSNAGADQTNCNNPVFNLSANTPADGESGIWSVAAGSAILSDFQSPLSSVTINSASATLVWSITNSLCPGSSSSSLVLASRQPAVSDAGASQTIPFATAGNAILNANIPQEGTGTWSVRNGPSLSPGQFSDVSNPDAVFTPAGGGGEYLLTWTISNPPCAVSASDVTIMFINIAPIANAGRDTTLVLPENSLAVNGTGSFDPDGGLVSYQWSLVSGPAPCVITNPLNAQTTLQQLSEGVYRFLLKVTDNHGRTASDTLEVRVSSRILIDLGSYTPTNSPDSSGRYWNNMGSALPGIRVPNAVTSTNMPSGIRLQVVSRIDGTFDTLSNGLGSNQLNGLGAVGNVGDYPSTATDDFGFSHTSTGSGRWRLSGLDSAAEYRIKFWGSRLLANRIIEIKAAEDTVWQSYDAAFNRDFNRAAVFRFSGKKQMDFDIRVKSGSLFGIISVIDISRVSLQQFNDVPAIGDSDRNYCGTPFKIAVLGSSTAFGTGAVPASESWVNRFTAYLKRKNPANELYNLAVPGITTYQALCPDGFVPPAGRPAPLFEANISQALRLGVNGLIINLPSNDAAAGYTLEEQQANFERVAELARQNNIAFWVCTPQPRNDLNDAQREQLKTLRSWILGRFGNMAVDFWSGIAQADGTLVPTYNFDNIHLNNAGHELLFGRMQAETVLDSLCARGNRRPVAVAGNDTTIRQGSGPLLLDGTRSSVFDGSITAYRWTGVSGAAGYLVSSPDSARTALSNLSEGVYVFRLQVTDNYGRTADDSITVKVASRILVDVGTQSLTFSPDAGGNYWNNLASGAPGIQLQNAITTLNSPTSLNIEVVNRIDGTYEPGSTGTGSNSANGAGTVGAVGDYPATATDDYAYAHTSTNTGRWRFSGLDSTAEYRIKFWGSRLLTNRVIEIKRTDEGEWQSYDAANNRDFNRGAYFSFSGLKEVSFDIRVGAGSQFGIISVIDIQRIKPADIDIPLPESGDSDRVYCGLPYKIVVLGSSTAFGNGALPIENSWVNKYRDYIKRKNPASEVYNLGIPGFTTYHALCPDGFTPPAGRPAPAFGYNISEALRLDADAIIINLPSNDAANNYTLEEQQANFERVSDIARLNNIPIWVTTSQPRNDLNSAQRDQLPFLRDWILSRFGNRAIDFWSMLSNADGTILPAYNADNIHLNNAGHDTLYRRVLREMLLDSLCIAQSRVPVARAGNDTALYLPASSLLLDGSASFVYEAAITSYQWSYVSGPPGTVLANPDSSTALLSNLAEGVHLYRLQVTDNYGRTGSDSIRIRVAAGRMLIDIGSSTLTASPDANGNHWNNMVSALPGIRVSNAVTTGNQPTSVSLEVVNRIDGTLDVSADPVFTNTPLGVVGPVGDYPATATDDYTFSHGSATEGRWRISGLDAGKTYTVKFWGARLIENRRIDIRLSGDSVWQTYDAANNRDYNRAAVFTFTGRTDAYFDIRSNLASPFGIINIVDISFVNATSQSRPAYASVSTSTKPHNILSDDFSGLNASVKVYPVPVRRGQELVIESGTGLSGEMMLINTLGIPVVRFRAVKVTRLPTSGLAKGVYRLWNGKKVLASILVVE